MILRNPTKFDKSITDNAPALAQNGSSSRINECFDPTPA